MINVTASYDVFWLHSVMRCECLHRCHSGKNGVAQLRGYILQYYANPKVIVCGNNREINVLRFFTVALVANR